MKKRTGLAGPESGQGTVEYILVLVVVIIIILSLLYRFHSSFRSYTENFFDGYIACLLETGELPGTGAICKEEYQSFDPKGGNQLLKDKLPEGRNAGKKDKGGAAQHQANNSRRGEASGGYRNGGYEGRLGGGFRSRETAVGTVAPASSDSSSNGRNSMISMSNNTYVGRTQGDYHGPRTVEYGGGVETEKDSKDVAAKSTVKRESAADKLRGAKGFETLNRKPAAKSDKDGEGFSISGFIRFLLIILIVVAMVIFFGGQLMQIARSREKGGGD